ncbi:MAG: arginase family protein [Proteobacteria bacterium]|nr:arginase family protein [Pseudomonadota bacterium]
MAPKQINSARSNNLFAGPKTFMNVPFSTEPNNSLAAILGVPFDAGTSATRVGARAGPAAIREQSCLLDHHQPPQTLYSPLERLKLVDCGDVILTPSVIEPFLEQTEAAARMILNAGAAPLAFGGDGMVSLPLLRAAKTKYPDLAVIHIDAHTDTYRSLGNSLNDLYNTATTFTRAAEEGLIDTQNSYHIGIRGTASQPDVFEHTREHGYQVIEAKTLFETGLDKTAEMLRANLKGKSVYLCFDMDFFDPSCAPGVCSPTWGGASAREGLGFLQDLTGIDFIGADINTVSPPQDPSGMTALLAANVAFEILTLFCNAPSLQFTITPKD